MAEALRWDVTPTEAVALQRRYASRVVHADDFAPPRRVAGVDVGFPDGGTVTRAAVSVLAFPSLEPLEDAVVELPTRFPYVPGLLSFREVPAMLEALEALACTPDVILCDGHGLAHPRAFGSACHLGLATGCATIGVGKSRLFGEHREPGRRRGNRARLTAGGKVIGSVLRTRTDVRPVYVSTGHRVTLDTAVRLVLACAPRFRLPEPIRAADRLASSPAR